MPEPTLRELERLILKGHGEVAQLRSETARLAARVEESIAQQSGNLVLAAKIDELTSSVDHLSDKQAAAEQILNGVRSLGKSSFDIATGLSRRLRNLVQALVQANLISTDSLRLDDSANDSDNDQLRLAAERARD